MLSDNINSRFFKNCKSKDETEVNPLYWRKQEWKLKTDPTNIKTAPIFRLWNDPIAHCKYFKNGFMEYLQSLHNTIPEDILLVVFPSADLACPHTMVPCQ